MKTLDGELKRKRGRPKKDGGKRHRMSVRLSEDMDEKLSYICKTEGWSITQAIENMTKMQYNLTRFKGNSE